MGLHGAKNIESRFTRYVEGLVSVIGHADRAVPLHDYCLGLVMPGERKSVEPMAAITAPGRTAAQHQSLLHFVGQGGWSDDDVLGKVREMVLPAIERYGANEAWIIDDTSFPKQGRHSAANLGVEAGRAAGSRAQEGAPRRTQYDLGQGPRHRAACESVAHHQMAGRHQ